MVLIHACLTDISWPFKVKAQHVTVRKAFLGNRIAVSRREWRFRSLHTCVSRWPNHKLITLFLTKRQTKRGSGRWRRTRRVRVKVPAPSDSRGQCLSGDHLNVWKPKTHLTKPNDVRANRNQRRESNQCLIRCNAPRIDPPLLQGAASSALNKKPSITRWG